MNDQLLTGFAAVIAGASPIVLAVLGEVITERSGIINLSLNGVLLISAMVGFAAAAGSNSLLVGFIAAAFVGALAGILVAASSIYFQQSQVAFGFVLAMLLRDLSYFLGTPLLAKPGPTLQNVPVPFLGDLPIIGKLFFSHNFFVYGSLFVIFGVSFFIYRTRFGLNLRGIGENATAAFARGIPVNRLRIIYSLLGGALVGLAGAGYSLFVKPGWNGTLSGLDGIGWIVLSITIFGGWNPIRGAFGAYLFVFLQWLSLTLQTMLPDIPSQVLQVAPFPLMILTLVLINLGRTEWVEILLSRTSSQRRWIVKSLMAFLGSPPPADLGKVFKPE